MLLNIHLAYLSSAFLNSELKDLDMWPFDEPLPMMREDKEGFKFETSGPYDLEMITCEQWDAVVRKL